MSGTERLQVGRTLGATLRLVGRHWGAFLVLAVLFGFLPGAFFGFAEHVRTASGDPPGPDGNGLEGLAAFVMTAPMALCVTSIGLADLQGRKLGLWGGMKAGFEKLGPGLWVLVLQSLGIGLGLVLGVAPGVILALMWAVALPLQFDQGGKAIDSLVRSGELSEGSRWPLLGLLAILVGLSALIYALLYAVEVVVWLVQPGLALALGTVVIGPLVVAVFGLMSAAGAMTVYGELVRLKGGAG